MDGSTGNDSNIETMMYGSRMLRHSYITTRPWLLQSFGCTLQIASILVLIGQILRTHTLISIPLSHIHLVSTGGSIIMIIVSLITTHALIMCFMNVLYWLLDGPRRLFLSRVYCIICIVLMITPYSLVTHIRTISKDCAHISTGGMDTEVSLHDVSCPKRLFHNHDSP